MLIITLVYNKKIKTVITFKVLVLLLTVPYILYWYVLIIYNAFLNIYPFSYHFIILTLFFISYLIIYLFWEFN